MKTCGKGETIPFVKEKVIYKQVTYWNDIVKSKTTINSCFELGMLWSMHPLKY